MNGRAAGVDEHPVGAEGPEEILFPGQGVEYFQSGLSLVGEQLRTQIALPRVGKNDDDETILHFPGLFQGHMHGGAGTHTRQDSLLPGKPPGHGEGVLVVDVHDLIKPRPVKDARLVGLLHVLETLDPVTEIGLHAHDPDVLPVLFQPAGASHGRSRCSQGGDHHGHPPFRLTPDFFRCPVVVGVYVILVVELIGNEIGSRMLPVQRVGVLDGPIRPEGRRGEVKFRPHGLQDFFRSSLTPSDMARISLYPLTADTRARPMPVFPLVASRIVLSFVSSPVFPPLRS